MTSVRRNELFGLPIAAVQMSGALDIVHEAITQGSTLHIGVVNAAKIVNMRKDAALREAVLKSDVIFADGMSVVWAARLLGKPLPERVTGIDLMMGIFERGNAHGYRVYLLGAQRHVIEKVAARMAREYPSLRLVGYRDGYFREDEEAEIAAKIAAARPDVLFVAMTSPKKERFLADWGLAIGAHVYHGVGGSFDIYGEFVRRAPVTWQRLGIEWLYRLLQEPSRLWKRYMRTNLIFVWLVARSLFVTERHRTTSPGSRM